MLRQVSSKAPKAVLFQSDGGKVEILPKDGELHQKVVSPHRFCYFTVSFDSIILDL